MEIDFLGISYETLKLSYFRENTHYSNQIPSPISRKVASHECFAVAYKAMACWNLQTDFLETKKIQRIDACVNVFFWPVELCSMFNGLSKLFSEYMAQNECVCRFNVQQKHHVLCLCTSRFSL